MCRGCVFAAKGGRVERLVWNNVESRMKLGAGRFEEIATQKVT